jgi:CheY-like chemotaxis protein
MRSTILVVDDDPLVRGVLVRQLARTFEIVQAASAAEAIPLLEKHGVVAVISDLVMETEDAGLRVSAKPWRPGEIERALRDLIAG